MVIQKGDLRVTYGTRFIYTCSSIGTSVIDFLFAKIEYFSLALTVETL